VKHAESFPNSLSKIIQQDARDEAETESEILPGMLCWDTLAHA